MSLHASSRVLMRRRWWLPLALWFNLLIGWGLYLMYVELNYYMSLPKVG